MIDYKTKGRKLAQLLYNGNNDGIVSFDFKSYEYDEDIPHIFCEGKRYNVETAKLSRNGIKLKLDTICCADNIPTQIELNLDDTEERLDDTGVDSLLYDMYYETDESGDLGDFEDYLSDFGEEESFIKGICFGRDDIQALADNICFESGYDSADSDVLREEIAQACYDYLVWLAKPVAEE